MTASIQELHELYVMFDMAAGCMEDAGGQSEASEGYMKDAQRMVAELNLGGDWSGSACELRTRANLLMDEAVRAKP